MKYLTRYFCALLCFLLLLTAFSVTASAKSVDIPNYHIYQEAVLKGTTSKSLGSLTWAPIQDDVSPPPISVSGSVAPKNGKISMLHSWKFSTDDNTEFVGKGETVTFSIANLYNSWYIEGYGYCRKPEEYSVRVEYFDDSVKWVTPTLDYESSSPLIDLEFTFEPEKNVTEFVIYIECYYNTSTSVTATTYLGDWGATSQPLIMTIDQSSEESGLLKSMIDWLKGIKDGITNVFNSIAELPSKIWSFIENGLKSLFVPSEDFIVEFKSNMQDMLSQKLGAVYQVLDITFNSWDRIKDNDTTNTINLPETTINLPDNNKFSFGGYDVKIVPDGFSFIVTIIKSIVGIVCTILFVNGLRRRYDEIMGVEK